MRLGLLNYHQQQSKSFLFVMFEYCAKRRSKSRRPFSRGAVVRENARLRGKIAKSHSIVEIFCFFTPQAPTAPASRCGSVTARLCPSSTANAVPLPPMGKALSCEGKAFLLHQQRGEFDDIPRAHDEDRVPAGDVVFEVVGDLFERVKVERALPDRRSEQL